MTITVFPLIIYMQNYPQRSKKGRNAQKNARPHLAIPAVSSSASPPYPYNTSNPLQLLAISSLPKENIRVT